MFRWCVFTCFFFFFLIIFGSVICTDDQCNYIVQKSDNSSDSCLADQCYKFIDLLSIRVEPKTCKTSILLLSFSSYSNFVLFRNKLQWQIGDLFLSRTINKDRQFILFIDQLDYNDRPFDHDELIQLGIHIDLYTVYIKNILNKNYLYGLIHYDPENPQWNIIKIKFRCLKLSAFDKYPCSSEFISPPLFAPQRMFLIPESTINVTNLTSYYVSMTIPTEESIIILKDEKKTSIQFILIIIIPLLIVFITILLVIFLYMYMTGRFSFSRRIMPTPDSSSRTSTPEQSIRIERNSSSSLSSLSINTIVPESRLNIAHMPNPTIYHDYQHHTKTHSTKNRNTNYERVTLDNISINGEQHFVRISSRSNF